MKYKVSICVPIFGVEGYIERCAKSLFEQTYDNIEYVFVDDKSTDKSIELLEAMILQYPLRKDDIKIVKHNVNRGLAAARNTAVEHATGEFILHVDSDDWIDITCVEKLIKKQKEDSAEIISFEGFSVFLDYKEKITFPDYVSPKDMCMRLLSGSICANVWAMLIKRSLYVDNNLKVIEGYNMGEDRQITPKLAFFATKVSTLHECLYYYECRNIKSYTNSFSEEKCRQKLKSRKVLFDFFLDKGPEYLEALEKGECIFVLGEVIQTSRMDDLTWCKHFLNKFHQYEKRMIMKIPITKRIIYYLDNVYMVKWYVAILTKVKHFGQIVYGFFFLRST